MNTAHVIPDCTHIARADAHDLAVAIVASIRATGRSLRVYLGPDGSVGYEWLGEPSLGDCMSLVGSYTEEATVGQVAEDLLAMERERIA